MSFLCCARANLFGNSFSSIRWGLQLWSGSPADKYWFPLRIVRNHKKHGRIVCYSSMLDWTGYSVFHAVWLSPPGHQEETAVPQIKHFLWLFTGSDNSLAVPLICIYPKCCGDFRAHINKAWMNTIGLLTRERMPIACNPTHLQTTSCPQKKKILTYGKQVNMLMSEVAIKPYCVTLSQICLRSLTLFACW